ncbi:MAG TPA: hypothetical protein VFT70_00650 [Nocardioides sp.]|nr:hypothetical protein [Nocardioides sp.]
MPDSAASFVKSGAPLHGTGFGSTNHGTLDQWRAAFPNANVLAYGFSLGSGVQGEGVIHAINFADGGYDVARPWLSLGYQSSIQAAPGETVEYRITVANKGTATAGTVVVTDPLPADLTYVTGSLVDNGNGCAFTGQKLTCDAGSFPPGTSSSIYFKAKVSDTVSSAGMGSTIGHIVDVQKQEVFADLPGFQTKTYDVMCPAGYVPTDGGLLLDAVDQDGFYSAIVVMKSAPTVLGGVNGWTVTASNLGEERGQGKVKVTCLAGTIGSANGHTHEIDTTSSNGPRPLSAGASGNAGELVTATCPAGSTPIAPQHSVASGSIAVVRSSYADGNSWKWVVDHEAGTVATFDVDCLASQTKSSSGHTATLPISSESHTITVAPEKRDEGIEQCGSSENAIVGGFKGEDAELLSLGKEPRGNNYMFRFYNDDWEQPWHADISVTCVGVRTPDEPRYYHVVNTATVSSDSTGPRSSSADIAIVGDAVQPSGGVLVGPTATRSGTDGHIKKLTLQMACSSACAFTVKVLQGGTVVAKGTKSLAGSDTPKNVVVTTTRAGKDLTKNDVVTVKVTTPTSTTSTAVKIKN